jgi:hypothetical protein
MNWYDHLRSCVAVNHGGQATCRLKIEKQGPLGDDDDDDEPRAWVKDWRRFTDPAQQESSAQHHEARLGAYGNGGDDDNDSEDSVATGAGTAAGPFRPVWELCALAGAYRHSIPGMPDGSMRPKLAILAPNHSLSAPLGTSSSSSAAAAAAGSSGLPCHYACSEVLPPPLPRASRADA